MGEVLQFSWAQKLPKEVGSYCSLQQGAFNAAAAIGRGEPLSTAPIVQYLRLLQDPGSTPGVLAYEAALSLEAIAAHLLRTANLGEEWILVLTAAAEALYKRWAAQHEAGKSGSDCLR